MHNTDTYHNINDELKLIQIYCLGSETDSDAAFGELYGKFLYQKYKKEAKGKIQNFARKESARGNKIPLSDEEATDLSNDWINKTFIRLRNISQKERKCPLDFKELDRYMRKSKLNAEDYVRKHFKVEKYKPVINLSHILVGTAKDRKTSYRVKDVNDKKVLAFFQDLSSDIPAAKFLFTRLDQTIQSEIITYIGQNGSEIKQIKLVRKVKDKLNLMIKEYDETCLPFLCYSEFDEFLNEKEKTLQKKWAEIDYSLKSEDIKTLKRFAGIKSFQFSNRDMLSRVFDGQIDKIASTRFVSLDENLVNETQDKKSLSEENLELLKNLMQKFERVPRVDDFVKEFFSKLKDCCGRINAHLKELVLFEHLQMRGKDEIEIRRSIKNCLNEVYGDNNLRSYKRYLRKEWEPFIKTQKEFVY